MTIIPYTMHKKQPLADLMAGYMAELDCGIPEDIIRGKLSELIDRQSTAEIIHVDLAIEGGTAMGFSIYQIDTPESDWCKRPGWGFIREFYIAPSYRKNGTGRDLARHTETQLRALGAKKLYLTSTVAVPFWQKCGWTLTETLCSNGQFILEK